MEHGLVSKLQMIQAEGNASYMSHVYEGFINTTWTMSWRKGLVAILFAISTLFLCLIKQFLSVEYPASNKPSHAVVADDGDVFVYSIDKGIYHPTNQTFGSKTSWSIVPYDELPPAFKDYKSNGYVNLLDVPRPEFLSNYKTPCWKQEVPSNKPGSEKVWQLRCLPYYYEPGFPKTGTTDLHAELNRHPLIMRAQKSPHYWSWKRIGYCLRHSDFSEPVWPLTQYLDKYKSPTEELANITLSSLHMGNPAEDEDYHPAIYGDATPSILWSNFRWRSLPENEGRSLEEGPRYHTGHYIAHFTPQARIIVTMRNPTNREYSWYMYNGHGNSEQSALDFHEKVVASLGPMETCLRMRTAWSCVNDMNVTDIVNCRRVRLQLGMYAVWLKEWLKVFPRNQFYFATLEEYSVNKTEVVNNMFTFLGLEPLPEEENKRDNVKNTSGKKKIIAGPMLPKTKTLLDNFYRPYNRMLADLLEDEKYSYLD